MEIDRAPCPDTHTLSASLGVCLRLGHTRTETPIEAYGLQGTTCDVCLKAVPKQAVRSSCRLCNVDICATCNKPDVLAAALHRTVEGWPTKKQLFGNDPVARATQERMDELYRTAFAILRTKHTPLETRAHWKGEFIAAAFPLTKFECGEFSFVEIVHCLNQNEDTFSFCPAAFAPDLSWCIVSVMYKPDASSGGLLWTPLPEGTR